MNNLTSKQSTMPVVAFLAAACLSKLVVVFWALNKGFDIGDEGFYLIGYQHPFDYPCQDYYGTVHSLFGWIDLDIFNTRLIAVLLELAWAVIFSLGLYSWGAKLKLIPRSTTTFGTLLMCCLLGSFLNIFGRCLSYNTLSNFNTYCTASILLLLSSKTMPNDKVRCSSLPPIAILGLLTGVQALSKLPTAILILAANIAFFFHLRRGARATLMMLAVYAASCMAAMWLLCLPRGGLPTWLNNTAMCSEVLKLMGYNIPSILHYYITMDYKLVLVVLICLATYPFFHFMYRLAGKHLSSKNEKNLIAITIPMLGFLVVHIAVSRIRPDFLEIEQASPLSYYSAMFAIVFILLAGFIIKNRNTPTRAIVDLIYIASLPFMIMAGTAATLSETIFAHIMPWFGIIGLGFAGMLTKAKRHVAIFSSAMILLIVASSVQFAYSYFIFQFGVGTLTDQKYEVSGVPKIKFDKDTQHFWDTLQVSLKNDGFTEGDAIVNFNMMSGIPYLLGGYSPETPVFMIYADDFNCQHLENIRLKKGGKKPYVIYRHEPSEKLLQCLRSSALGFPDGYELLLKIENPYAIRGVLYPSPQQYLYVFSCKQPAE